VSKAPLKPPEFGCNNRLLPDNFIKFLLTMKNPNNQLQRKNDVAAAVNLKAPQPNINIQRID